MDPSWDVIAGIWPDPRDAAAMAALLIGTSDGNLRLVQYKNYNGPTLVLATRRGDPAQDAMSDRLSATLDQTLKEFHEQAVARPSDTLSSAPMAEPARRERAFPARRSQELAHDLNNLLTVILCCGEVLADKMEGDESGISYLKDLLTATVRAERLAARFLDPGVPDVVDVASLVAESRHMLRTMAGSKLALTINLSPERAEVLIDKRSLESIICDIVLHARLAMPQGGGWLRIGIALSEIRPGSQIALEQGSYVRITFDYSPPPAGFSVAAKPLPTTRETALEAGLSRAFLQVESVSGRMFIDRDGVEIARVTVYLALAELRKV